MVDGTSVCAASLHISVTAACSISCRATVPASGQVNTPVPFQASSSTSNCTGSVTYSWDFGDGSTSTLEDPTHTYATTGTYGWSLVAAVDGTTCERSGTITIGSPPTSTYVVPGVAHAPGAAGTNWRTKLSILNRSGSTAQVSLDYVRTTKLMAQTVTLADGELLAWDDVAVYLFGITDNSSGAVVVTSSRSLIVGARTYNQGSSGTYGQFLQGVTEAEALTPGQTGVISMLSKNSSFRTNIGFVKLGDSSCQVQVTLHDTLGNAIGSQRTVTVPAMGWKQDSDIFAAAGVSLSCDLTATDSSVGGQYYAVYEVRVSAQETLTAEIDPAGTSISDTVMPLYCNPFDANDPHDNLIAYDDDGGR